MDRLQQLQEFLLKDPDDPFLQYAIAIEYVGREHVDKAQKILLELKVKSPDYTALYYHLGKLYQNAGDRETAEEIYREGIQRTTIKREQHQLAELQTALNNMLYEE